jgi:hypothetical protein
MAPERVLVVTYLFPPSGGVGVPRFVSYARYLPEHGCEVSILTVRKPATPAYDPYLAKQVPPETHVHRAFNPEVPYGFRDRIWKKIIGGGKGGNVSGKGAAPEPTGVKGMAKRAIQRIFCPDVQVVWGPFAIRAAKKIIREEGITTVLVNLPPYSVLKIAAAIKRAFPRVKMILDFRDEWIENYFSMFDTAATSYKLNLAKRLERDAVELADYVTAVTTPQLKQIRDRYPEQPDSKFVYAPNGFDPELYSHMRRRKHEGDKMVVTYFGTVYANEAYDPILNYLDVLDALPEEIRDNIETRFIGRITAEAMPFFENRRSPIKQYGFMSRFDALEYLGETDYTLIVAGNPTTHGGKLFDYLATGRPILAICPVEGQIGEMLRETKTGTCVNPGDMPAIRQMLLDSYERFRSGSAELQPNLEAVRFFEWPNLVGRLAKLVKIGSYR